MDADLGDMEALEPLAPGGAGGRRRRDRRAAGVGLGLFVVAVVLLGVLAAVHDGGGHDPGPDPGTGDSVAEQQVLSALDLTAATGSFDVEYRFSETIGSQQPPPTECSPSRPAILVEPSGGTLSVTPADGCWSGEHQPVTVTGQATVNTDPKAMVASADISGGLSVTIRLVGDQLWEEGGAMYGLASGGGDGPGQPLSGFASLVSGTLGNKMGALAMTRMASPNAYLAIERPSITAATSGGTSTIDGVAVTDYTVTVDLNLLASIDGLTRDERATMDAALAQLHANGYESTTDTISVDEAGMIRRVVSVSSFADGSTVTWEGTYTRFGCAGTVQAPGHAATDPPPCPVMPTTTTSAAVPPSSDGPPTSGTIETTTSTTSEPTTSPPTTLYPTTSTTDPTVTTSDPPTTSNIGG